MSYGVDSINVISMEMYIVTWYSTDQSVLMTGTSTTMTHL